MGPQSAKSYPEPRKFASAHCDLEIVPKWELTNILSSERVGVVNHLRARQRARSAGKNMPAPCSAGRSLGYLIVLCTTVNLGFGSAAPVGVAILIDAHLLFVRSIVPPPVGLGAALIM